MTEYDLEHLKARAEIEDVLYRRARASDRLDRDLALSCYHPDATEEHEGFTGTAEKFLKEASITAPGSESPVQMMWHFLSNILVEFDDNEADVESYHIAVVGLEADGEVRHATIGGRYLDRFAKRNGRWAITHRVVVFDWSRVEPVVETWWSLMGHDTSKVLFGSFGPDDPVYDRLNVSRGA